MQNSLRLSLITTLLGITACGPQQGVVPEANQNQPSLEEEGEASALVEVWLDVDPATGLPQSEVDDGLMMLQAFHSPELLIRGVSVVFGNTSLDKGLPVARQITSRFGPPDLQVHAGASTKEQLGERTDAVTAMAAALEQAPMTIAAVGPVTNVASLLNLHPELIPRIDRILMVAARREGQSFVIAGKSHTPFRDFNFELDPEAMQVVLDSGVPLVFAPWEVSSHVWLRDEDMEWLRDRSEAGAWVAEACVSWLERWRDNLDADGFNPFDTLAIGWLTHPELFLSMKVDARIEELADDTQPGSGATKPHLLVREDDGSPAVYLYEPLPEFNELLKQRLAGPPEVPLEG